MKKETKVKQFKGEAPSRNEDKSLIEIVDTLNNNEFINVEYGELLFFIHILEFEVNKKALEKSKVKFNMFYRMNAARGNYMIKRLQNCTKKLNELEWFNIWLRCSKRKERIVEVIERKTFDFYFRNKIWF